MSFVLKLLNSSESEKKYFLVRAARELDPETFKQTLQARGQKTALVFVHGYNTSFDDGLFRLAQIAHDGQLKRLLVPVLFSWPSQKQGTAYNIDGEMAELSEKFFFLELLEFLRNKVQIENIHIIAHSMGNRVVLKALDKVIARTAPPLAEVIFAAAYIPQLTFRELAATVGRGAKGMTLYASAHDAALWWSTEGAGQLPRAGSVINNMPIIVEGVESIDMSAANPAKSALEKVADLDLLGLNTHNTFVSPVIVDIARLLSHGEHPPHLRTANIRGFPDGSATPTYWYYATAKS